MAANIRVLFIDDQQDFVQPLSYWMMSKGYDVITAFDGPTGIDHIKNQLCDLVFLDYKMPGMDGAAVLKNIRSFNPHIPVVLVTSYLDEAIMAATQEMNVTGFFSKMGNFTDLEKVLTLAVKKISAKF